MAIALAGGSDGPNITGINSQISSDIKKGSGEMLGGCSVCLDDQGTEENPLVYCDGCEVAVHQACYGIVDVPPGNWFCRKCEFGEGQSNMKCELCPSKDGALKKTETGLWAHVVCALYIPEVRFGNNNTMEPIEIKHIQADRYNKNCYICEESGNSSKATYGAVMDCHKLNCKQSFHVTCAQSSGLLCEEAGQGSDNVIYCGYCKHHFRKLKAGNRKTSGSLNNSRSSYLDSASDSSQDNDSRCNTTTENDKNSNRTNKLPNIPTNLSTTDAPLVTNSHSSVPIATANSKTGSSGKNAPISLTIPFNSTSKSTTNTGTPLKKKRNPKGVQNNTSSASNTNNSSTLLSTATTLSNSSIAPPTTNIPHSVPLVSNRQELRDPHDIYNWSEKDQFEKTPSNSKSSKKKPPNSTQTSSSKATNPQQSLSVPNYNLQKVGSPNLSLSTSPSLASPSNSTKSTSNCSTSSASTTTATSSSSSSSSTSSNSPSPALLSPNISNKGSTIRLESPLASKTGSAPHNRSIHDSASISNISLPVNQSSLQTRINLDDPKNELKKNSLGGSSLLSTTVPMPLELLTDSTTASSSTNYTKQDSITASSHLASSHNSTNKTVTSKDFSNKPSTTGPASITNTNSNTQPTVPPLIIPVPQVSANSSSKSSAKTKSNAKSTRKKSTENSESSDPKPESKPKASRSKKATTASTSGTEISVTKPEPKRGKSKAAPKSGDTVNNSNNLSTESTAKSQILTSNPSKRKSRSASNESNTTSSPAKKPRKKKTDPPTATSELNSFRNSNQFTQGVPQSQSFMTSTSSGGPGPLMINTPVITNRLVQGMNSLDSHDANNRYFSPMISPYTSVDHPTAPSLSRSSLSRLFTLGSGDTHHTGSLDDPSKAFDELREGTWSHLSKFVLDQAQQFDIPSLIGTLYTLRSENDKLVNRVRDLTMKRDQLVAMSARLDLPGIMLTQHLNNTSPNFSSVVSGLTNSPKSLPAHSPGSAINKQPLSSVSAFNHLPPHSLASHGYLDSSSPLVGQAHSGMSSIKSSMVSTPSPPVGALMAHSNSNRTGLITVNPPYMSNVFQPMNSMTPLGATPQGSSYYPRQ